MIITVAGVDNKDAVDIGIEFKPGIGKKLPPSGFNKAVEAFTRTVVRMATPRDLAAIKRKTSPVKRPK
jgi:hypothetical protein